MKKSILALVAVVGLLGFAGSAPAADAAKAKGWVAANFRKPSDAELKKRLTPLQYAGHAGGGDRARVRQRVQRQQATGHLRRHRLRRAALLVARQVRLRHGMAELHEASREGERQAEQRTAPRGISRDRGSVRPRGLAPGPRLQRRTEADGPALLHELRGDALHPGREARRGGIRAVRVRSSRSRRRSKRLAAYPAPHPDPLPGGEREE